MKTKHLFWIFLLISVISFTSCDDDKLENNTPTPFRIGVLFLPLRWFKAQSFGSPHCQRYLQLFVKNRTCHGSFIFYRCHTLSHIELFGRYKRKLYRCNNSAHTAEFQVGNGKRYHELRYTWPHTTLPGCRLERTCPQRRLYKKWHYHKTTFNNDSGWYRLSHYRGIQYHSGNSRRSIRIAAPSKFFLPFLFDNKRISVYLHQAYINL